ncbi:hypothetical protein FNF31_07939 [Cafeteria roenbergensis]|uniref:SET domain-containing protein n=1 Tax=Cafeteria roenbergensis TaxID=33653 RepID=A0A5A8D6J4_CAFRO|nr:hypothetical protein FNF31_07939 [Cafeteria roenbergensis]KAA0160788.1 hypothetical protein FNF28_05312 [Cafeteria roenbergensis]
MLHRNKPQLLLKAAAAAAVLVAAARAAAASADSGRLAPGSSTRFVVREDFIEQFKLPCEVIVAELIAAQGANWSFPARAWLPDEAPPAARIARSPIEGIGLFAARSVDAGEDVLVPPPSGLVLDYEGPGFEFDTACCGSGVATAADHMDRILTSLGTLYVAPMGIDLFPNHSPDPNCRVEVRFEVRDEPGASRPALVSMRTVLVALRSVAQGEEITYDYGTFMDARIDVPGEHEPWLVTEAQQDVLGCGESVTLG